MITLFLLACGGGQEHWPEAAIPDRCAAGAGPSGEVVMDVPRPERTRRALVWVPEGPGPHDVIVNLHEYRSEPRRQAHYTDWVAVAREANAYLVGPDGKGAVWNAGGCCGKAKDDGIDDVGFLDAVIERLDATGCTSGRVLATGIGNGGMMAHHWACSSDAVDAVVSVGGALQVPECRQERPIPVLMYHGADDTWMPLDGSGHHLTLAHAEQVWRARNRAGPAEARVDGPLDCRFAEGAAPTGVCVVAGMKDHWPGAKDAPLDGATGPLKDATRGAWGWVQEAWSPAAP